MYREIEAIWKKEKEKLKKLKNILKSIFYQYMWDDEKVKQMNENDETV